MMSKGYMIGLIKFTNKQQFIENFASKIGALIQSSGGRFLSRTPESHFSEGREFDLHVIVEFDELGRAKALLKSEKWKDMQQHRRAHSDTEYGSFMLIESGDTIAK